MFAFDANRHEYVDTALGEVLPHITGLLDAGGLIDDRWYTEESCERGAQVHRLTADFDLGAIVDPKSVTSKYKGWLQAHVKAMKIVLPTWAHVEEPLVSSRYRFGGRPDRVGLAYGAQSVLEVKSGLKDARAHGVQLALQAILVADELRLKPEQLQRWALYLKPSGKFKLEPFENLNDFAEAYGLIRKFCQVAA